MSEPIKTSAVFPTAGAQEKRPLSTFQVVVLVVAAAAPLAAIIGNAPLALGMPAGLGMPAAFLAVGVTLGCFIAGYTTLAKDIIGIGGFYTHIGQGLGKPAGVAAAYSAVLSYGIYTIGMSAAFGYFCSIVSRDIGFELPWLGCAIAGALFIGFLGYRSLDLSARVLGYFLAAEFTVLLAFDLLVLIQKGAAALPLAVWSPGAFLRFDIGAVIPFVVVCFIGFEAAALYGEETREPRRSIPRAAFAALAVIALFYMASVWIVIGAAGAPDVAALAHKESGNLLFALAETYGGLPLTAAFGVLLVASLLASYLALHNAASRYLFAVAADGLLPSFLAQFHPDYHSPHVASVLLSALTLSMVAGLGLYGVDPYLGIASATIGLGTIGIIAMQIACAAAVIAFFWKAQPVRLWTTKIAPALGALGLTSFLALLVANYSAITGGNNPVVNSLPFVFVPVIVAAILYALWLKRRRPNRYSQISGSRYRLTTERTAVKTDYTRRYCIVGAGPAGLIAMRAFDLEGIPYDAFERHSDLGGLWDPDNPGTPIYDSAHFISSKWTSYFYGFPMPDDYPDYPSAAQILAYIRAFARAYGLYEHVTFNTAVVSAEPDTEGWRVKLSNGETRRYAGIVACPGVTWHASKPDLPGAESFAGEIRHTVDYRSPNEFRGKRVLVIGAGNSGVDIASDAARTASRAFLSVRRGYRFVPKYLFGIPTDVLMSGKAAPPRGVAMSTDATAMLDALNGDLTRLGLPKPDHDALASHPIMNTEVLHHLGHGDLIAKPDVARLEGGRVVFKDGSSEEIDIVMLATGYNYKMPFFDEALFEWKSGRPQLYLNVIHRTQRGLYALGLAEFADAAYRRFDEMAQLIVADIHATQTGVGRDWIDAQLADQFPDLRGGKVYIDSPRHANYVNVPFYLLRLAEFRRKLGWPDLTDASYETLRRAAGASSRARAPAESPSFLATPEAGQ